METALSKLPLKSKRCRTHKTDSGLRISVAYFAKGAPRRQTAVCNTFRRVACASEAAAGSGCFVDLIYFTVTTLRRHRTRFSAITKSRMTKPGLFPLLLPGLVPAAVYAICASQFLLMASCFQILFEILVDRVYDEIPNIQTICI